MSNVQFHRFEKDLLMQGVMKHSQIPLNTVFGKCPDPQFEVKDKSKCPKHDPNCGCHGPIMTKGRWVGQLAVQGDPIFSSTSFTNPSTGGITSTRFGAKSKTTNPFRCYIAFKRAVPFTRLVDSLCWMRKLTLT